MTRPPKLAARPEAAPVAAGGVAPVAEAPMEAVVFIEPEAEGMTMVLLLAG